MERENGTIMKPMAIPAHHAVAGCVGIFISYPISQFAQSFHIVKHSIASYQSLCGGVSICAHRESQVKRRKWSQHNSSSMALYNPQKTTTRSLEAQWISATMSITRNQEKKEYRSISNLILGKQRRTTIPHRGQRLRRHRCSRSIL